VGISDYGFVPSLFRLQLNVTLKFAFDQNRISAFKRELNNALHGFTSSFMLTAGSNPDQSPSR
jgi:hypothetical protein